MSSLFSIQVDVTTGRWRGTTVTGERVGLRRADAAGLLVAARAAGDVVYVRSSRYFITYYLRMPNVYLAGRQDDGCRHGRSVPPVAVL